MSKGRGSPKGKNITIDDIRSKLPEEKEKLLKVTNPWCHFVVRPISYYPSWLFLRLGISANKVTTIGTLIGVIGCLFLALGSYWEAIAGAILVNVRFLFDVADGNVARCTNSCTKYGAYIDVMSSYAMAALIPIAVGIGVYNHPDHYLCSLFHFFFGVEVNNSLYLVLGTLTSFLYISTFLVSDKFGLTFSMTPTEFYKPEANSRRGLWSFIYRVGFILENEDGIVLPLLFLVAITGVLSIFLFLWAVIVTCGFVAIVTRTLMKARRVINEET